MNKVYITVILVLTISIAYSSSIYSRNTDGPPSKDSINLPNMSRVNIPAREHGYKNLKNIVIYSTTEFNEYIQLIEQQSALNNKTKFVSVLQSENIDFDSMNLLIYFHTEGSGSIGVSLAEPGWGGENIVVNITRSDPEIGTLDMAYYAYAFKVNKTIPKVVFTIGDTRVEIENNDT